MIMERFKKEIYLEGKSQFNLTEIARDVDRLGKNLTAAEIQEGGRVCVSLNSGRRSKEGMCK
jgi:hypothetical protein